MASHFYNGSVAEGSAEALKRDLSLVFFVAGEDWLSMKWESVYLKDPEILPLLGERSILFKLQSGSAEAGIVAMFSAAQTAPYLVVVKNSSLVAKIGSEASEEEFRSTIKRAFPPPPPPSPPPPPEPPAQASSNPLADLFAERRQMLELRMKSRVDSSHTQAQEQQRARRESITPERAKYVAAESKRIAEEKAERARILALVRNDQIERSAKAARKLEQKKAASPGAEKKEEEKEKEKKGGLPSPISVAFNEVVVTFRLLDGNTITARFMETSRLGSNVRNWVEKNRTDGTEEFLFMEPPHRKFSAFDENLTLRELKIPKVSTLVLVRR